MYLDMNVPLGSMDGPGHVEVVVPVGLQDHVEVPCQVPVLYLQYRVQEYIYCVPTSTYSTVYRNISTVPSSTYSTLYRNISTVPSSTYSTVYRNICTVYLALPTVQCTGIHVLCT